MYSSYVASLLLLAVILSNSTLATLADGSGEGAAYHVLPCDNATANVTIASNTTYTLRDCYSNQTFITLLPNVTTYEVVNVSVKVFGGSVLPRLDTSHRWLARLVNVSIYVEGVIVTKIDKDALYVPLHVSMLCVRDLAVGAVVRSLTVHVIASVVQLDIVSSSEAPTYDNIVSLCVYVDGNLGSSIHGVLIMISNTSIVLRLSGAHNFQTASLMALYPQNQSSVSGVRVTIHSGTSVHVALNMSAVNNTLFQPLFPSMFMISCPSNSQDFYDCRVSDVLVLVNATSLSALPPSSVAPNAVPGGVHLTIEEVMPGTLFAIEMVSIVSITAITAGDNIHVSFYSTAAAPLSLTSRCGCEGADCAEVNTTSLDTAFDLSTRIFFLQGTTQKGSIPRRSVVRGLTFNISGPTNITLESPKTSFVATYSYFALLEEAALGMWCQASAALCLVTIRSRGLDIGSAARNLGVFEISNADNATGIRADVSNAAVAISGDAGGAIIVSGTVVGFLSNVSDATVHLVNVSLRQLSDNATIKTLSMLPKIPIEVSILTMMTSLVNINPQSPDAMDTGRRLRISIVNASAWAVHTTNLPATNVTAAPFSIPIQNIPSMTSVIAAVNLARSLDACTITLRNVSVVRGFPDSAGPASWLPAALITAGGIVMNVTSIVNALDATTTASNFATEPLVRTLLPTLLKTNGTAIAEVQHTNVALSLLQNCTVQYERRLLDSANLATDRDILAMVTFPVHFKNSSVLISTSYPYLEPGRNLDGDAGFGSVVGSLGATVISNSTVVVRDARTAGTGIAMLLHVTFNPLVLANRSWMLFDNIEVRHNRGRTTAPDSPAFASFPIGSTSGSAQLQIIDGPWSAAPPQTEVGVFQIFRSSFSGFTSLIRVSDMNVTTSIPSSLYTISVDSPVLVELGCNVWDGEMMTTASVVGLATPPLPFTVLPQQPSGAFNATITCDPPAAPPSAAVSPTVAAAITSVAGIVGAAFSSGLDAQVLVAIGVSPCAPLALRQSTTSSQFLLSPFYQLGSVAMVLGNIAIFAILHAAHRLLVYYYTVRHRAAVTLFHVPPTPQSVAAPRDALAFAAQAVVHATAVPPRVAAKYPNHSIAAGGLLATGIVVGGVRGLWSGAATETCAAGAVALIAVAMGTWWRAAAGRGAVAQRLRFVPYTHAVRFAFAAPWALPIGQWGPSSRRATHGRLRGAVRPGAEWLSAHVLAVGLTVQGVASIPVPSSWCVGLWCVVASFQFMAACGVMYFRPSRAPLSDVLLALTYIATASVQVAAGLASSGNDSASLHTALTVLPIVAMLTSLVKSAHGVFVVLWERSVHLQPQVTSSLSSTVAFHGPDNVGRGGFAEDLLLALDGSGRPRKVRAGQVSATDKDKLSWHTIFFSEKKQQRLDSVRAEQTLAVLVDWACSRQNSNAGH